MRVLPLVPYIALGIVLVALIIYAVCDEIHGFKLKQEHLETLIYVLGFGMVVWYLKNTVWFSRSVLDALIR